MNPVKTVTPSQLNEFLLNVAVVRPVFICTFTSDCPAILLRGRLEHEKFECSSKRQRHEGISAYTGCGALPGRVHAFCLLLVYQV